MEYFMEKRLITYLEQMRQLTENLDIHSFAEKERMLSKLLIQISFFQHERLIHLIVTVTFALLAVSVTIGVLLTEQIALLLLDLLIVTLLIPYIRHYYILENGVQKLYEYYDKIEAWTE